MIYLAIIFAGIALAVLGSVARVYGLEHPATRYSVRPAPRALPKLAPIVFDLRGGGTLVARDSVDVAAHGRATYESNFERWQRERAAAVREHFERGRVEVPRPLGFAPEQHARQPRNRAEKRRAEAMARGGR